MTDKLIELVPLVVVLTGVIAAIFAYRQAERQNDSRPALHAIGGALASEGAAKIHAEEIQRLAKSLDLVAESQFSMAKATRDNAARWKDMLDEIEHIRRSLQDIATLMRHRN